MASARSRLTVAYAVALVGTVVLLAGVLWAGRPLSGLTALGRPAAEADSALAILRRAASRDSLLIPLALPDSILRDSLGSPVDTGRTLTGKVLVELNSLSGLVFVFARDGSLLFESTPATVRGTAGRVEFFSAIPTTLGNRAVPVVVPLRGEQMLVATKDYPEHPVIWKVVSAVPMRSLVLGVREVAVAFAVIAPLVLLVSIGGAYLIAGVTLQPIERIINEVEAITDGRSLHRRLAVDGTSDELARLGATLNAMLSRLATSFDALRRFTADASHELKTPLTVLRADVERAMSPRTTPTEQLVALEEALHETARMADLVESLLTLARADEGRFDLHRESVAMEPLVREVFETAHILGEHAGQTVLLSVVEEATVLGDRTRLRQLFLNLVTNAIKYTPHGGRVEISLSNRLDCVTFTVKDTGIGISASDLPHVFERFYRADRARSRRVQAPDGSWTDERGGFGLGLAISQWIVRAHGGTLTATSRLGRGSVFTVSLPLDSPAPRDGASATTEGGGETAGPVAA